MQLRPKIQAPTVTPPANPLATTTTLKPTTQLSEVVTQNPAPLVPASQNNPESASPKVI